MKEDTLYDFVLDKRYNTVGLGRRQVGTHIRNIVRRFTHCLSTDIA